MIGDGNYIKVGVSKPGEPPSALDMCRSLPKVRLLGVPTRFQQGGLERCSGASNASPALFPRRIKLGPD